MAKTSPLFLGIAVVLLILASCNEDGPAEKASCAVCNISEQTNIQISGDLTIVDFTESLQNDASNDLISYDFYGDPSTNFNFIIQLQSGWKLTIELFDDNSGNPWIQVGQGFNAYPGKDLKVYDRYTRISLTKGSESLGYSTNPGSGIAPTTLFGVFKVTMLTENEIQGRLRDLVLYKVGSPAATLNIDGTFVGAVTYQPEFD
ncbi:MAG: hypothetical protein GY751_13190 [Bacteroidetes bacterium]|nr:hypothetical protein [Bacteroidota bacterium]